MNYPHWITRIGGQRNLREVGPRLFVGSDLSPAEKVSAPWELVVSMCGRVQENASRYEGAKRVISAQFDDGDPIPPGYLDKIVLWAISASRNGPVLIHCAAGLSRSASVAYAILRMRDGLTHDRALMRVQTPGHEHQYPLPQTLRSARAWVQEQKIKLAQLKLHRSDSLSMP